jgi:hypothetical protein
MRDTRHPLRSAIADTSERRSLRRQWECAILLSGALAAASFAPHPIVLPVVSVLLIAAAGFAAGYAWLRTEARAAREFTRWDQAGILVFAGFAAALTGDSADVLHFIETLGEQRIASE